MALDIANQTLLIDETFGIDANSDDTSTTNGLITYMTGLSSGSAGDMGTEVAIQTNFVVGSASAGETINALRLVNSSGEAFSATTGLFSGLYDVDGNEIWLFLDPDAGKSNVILGVVGNHAPSAGGIPPLAFSMALVPSGSTPNGADLYVVQYEAIRNNLNGADPNDIVDLAGKVYAAIDATQQVNFSQLSDAPPGTHDWYILDADVATTSQILLSAYTSPGAHTNVNVSETGVGAQNQSTNPGEILQVDLITGGTQSAGDFTSVLPTYTAHLENVTRAGFSISQTTPNHSVVDFSITAINDIGDETGASFGSDTTASQVDITGLIFIQAGAVLTATDLTNLGISYSITGNVATVHNVPVNTTIDFTTAGGASGYVDRFLIQNIEPDKGDSFDIREVHYFGQQTSAYKEDVGGTIQFRDDGPSFAISGDEPIMTVDESGLSSGSTPNAGLLTASGDFADIFHPHAGVDAQASLTYSLLVTDGTDSTLKDEATGSAILLYKSGNDVIGAINSGATEVFKVQVDTSGMVTLTLGRAIQHANTSSSDESILMANDNLIQLQATLVDKDNDPTSATIDIARNLIFKDDGPSITANGSGTSLWIDEASLANGTAPDSTQTSKTGSFAGIFSASYGADGAGTIKDFTLGVSAPNVDSGLVDSLSNQHVLLNKSGNDIVGTTAIGGDEVFRLAVDNVTGDVTLSMSRAVKEGAGENGDIKEFSDPMLGTAITLSATAYDKEGDPSSTASADIGGYVSFKDDGPTMLTPTSASNIDTFNLSFVNGAHNTGLIGGLDGAEGVQGANLSILSVDALDHFTSVISGDGKHVDWYFGTDTSANPWFKLDITDNAVGNDTYDFTNLHTGVATLEDLDFAKINPGSPVEKVTVSTEFNHAQITFDGLIFKGASNTLAPSYTNTVDNLTKPVTSAQRVDDINTDHLGFGIVGTNSSQASQINQNEGFVARVGEATDAFHFDIQGVGNNAKAVHVEYWVYTNDNDNNPLNGAGTLVEHGYISKPVLSGNALTSVDIDPAGGSTFDTVFARFTYTNSDLANGGLKGSIDNAGIRVLNFGVQTGDTIPEYDLGVVLQRTDQDSDYRTAHLGVHVDPDWIV